MRAARYAILSFLLLGFLAGPQPAGARQSIFDADSAGEQLPSTDEYNDVPKGILLTKEQRVEMQALDAQNAKAQAAAGQTAGQTTAQTTAQATGQPAGEAAAPATGQPPATNGQPPVIPAQPPTTPDTLATGTPATGAAPATGSGEEQNGENYTHKLNYDAIIDLYRQGKYDQIVGTLQSLAVAGHQGAEELLGIMYRQGQGVPKDPAKALDLLTKAALANRPLAQHHLGIVYFLGEGVTKDPITSLMWLDIAVLHYPDGPEKERAKQDRDNVYSQMSRRDRDYAQHLVRDWLNERGEAHLLDLAQ